jgi:hypothetical protein
VSFTSTYHQPIPHLCSGREDIQNGEKHGEIGDHPVVFFSISRLVAFVLFVCFLIFFVWEHIMCTNAFRTHIMRIN